MNGADVYRERNTDKHHPTNMDRQEMMQLKTEETPYEKIDGDAENCTCYNHLNPINHQNEVDDQEKEQQEQKKNGEKEEEKEEEEEVVVAEDEKSRGKRQKEEDEVLLEKKQEEEEGEK